MTDFSDSASHEADADAPRLEVLRLRSPFVVSVVAERGRTLRLRDGRGIEAELHRSIIRDNGLEIRDGRVLLPGAVYRHYFGRRVTEIRSAREREDLSVLARHFVTILRNARRIRETPELASAYSTAWLNAGVPIGTRAYLSIGTLIDFWLSGELVQPCPRCGGPAYAYRIIGSYMSGSTTAQGLCPACGAGAAGGESPAGAGGSPYGDGVSPPGSGDSPPGTGDPPAGGGESPAGSGESPASGRGESEGGRSSYGDGVSPPGTGGFSYGDGGTPAGGGESPPGTGGSSYGDGGTPAGKGESPPAAPVTFHPWRGLSVGRILGLMRERSQLLYLGQEKGRPSVADRPAAPRRQPGGGEARTEGENPDASSELAAAPGGRRRADATGRAGAGGDPAGPGLPAPKPPRLFVPADLEVPETPFPRIREVVEQLGEGE